VSRPPLIDVALATGLSVTALVEIWLPLESVMGDGSPELTTVVTLVMCSALALRQVRPLAAAVVSVSVWPITTLFAAPWCCSGAGWFRSRSRRTRSGGTQRDGARCSGQ